MESDNLIKVTTNSFLGALGQGKQTVKMKGVIKRLRGARNSKPDATIFLTCSRILTPTLVTGTSLIQHYILPISKLGKYEKS